MVLDIILVGIVAVITWCVASEGAWGAALMLVTVIISGLLATSFFEVTAEFLQSSFSDSYEWQHRWDVIALVGLFAGFVFAFRKATDWIMPIHIEVHGLVYDVTRWASSLATGYVTMAFLLTAFHTAPLPPDLLGFTAEPQRRGGPLGQSAPDMKWLGFVHHMTETAFRKGPDQSGAAGPIFDGPRYEMYPGGPEQIMPSFPIRYASRRDRYYGGAPAAAVPSGGSSSSPGRSGGGSGRPSGPRF